VYQFVGLNGDCVFRRLLLMQGSAADIRGNSDVRKAYLGL
jgi:hypothetical protein